MMMPRRIGQGRTLNLSIVPVVTWCALGSGRAGARTLPAMGVEKIGRVALPRDRISWLATPCQSIKP